MQNSNQKERNFGADNARDWMTDLSPSLIIFTFISSLIAFGVLKFNYQSELMAPKLGQTGLWVAGMTAVVSQFARLAFGLAGVRDLTRGREYLGWGGIIASIGLTFYEHKEALRMAAHWENDHLAFSFLFLVWVALFAEIRLIMTMSEKPLIKSKKKGNGHRSSKNGQHSNGYVDYEVVS